MMNIFSSSYDDKTAHCVNCRGEWERAKLSQCPGCGMATIDCSCVPELLRGVRILSSVRFGSIYSVDRLIYAIKRSKNKRLFDFVSEEMSHRLFLYMREFKKEAPDTVMTYVPRNPSSVAVYGHDHAEMLAKGVSERLGIELITALKRKRGGRAQKKLTAEERFENSKGRFTPCDREAEGLRGKTVILVDDVVTSGATAAACIELLRAFEPEEIVILSVAKSNLKNKKKKKSLSAKGREG